MEKTLVLIKPDAVKQRVVGSIISKYEENKLDISHIKILIPDRELLEEHYSEHENKPFFSKLVNYMSSGRVVAMILEGNNVIEKVRSINGNTDPKKAAKDTIRSLYGTDITYNAVHGSGSKEESEREINIWFDL